MSFLLKTISVCLSIIFFISNATSQEWLEVDNGLSRARNPEIIFNDIPNDRLLIAGRFDDPDFGSRRIYAYNKDSLINIEYTTNSVTSVTSFLYYNDELLVFGNFDTIGGVYSPCIAKLEGEQFIPFNGGDLSNISIINDAIIWQDDLLVVGMFDTIGGVYSPGVARWNGSQWFNVGEAIPNFNGFRLQTAIEYKEKLYVAGNYSFISEQRDLLVLEDGVWKVPPGWKSNYLYTQVLALQVFNDVLYVGGHFDKDEGSIANHIIGYNGTTWFELGEGPEFSVVEMIPTEDYLLVAGKFNYVDNLITE